MQKGFTRRPQADEPVRGKNYNTPGGLERLKDEHRFLLTRERPAVGATSNQMFRIGFFEFYRGVRIEGSLARKPRGVRASRHSAHSPAAYKLFRAAHTTT